MNTDAAQNKGPFSAGCGCACAVRLLSGRRVALMTLVVLVWRLLCPVNSLVICFRVPICTRTNSVRLSCGSISSEFQSWLDCCWGAVWGGISPRRCGWDLTRYWRRFIWVQKWTDGHAPCLTWMTWFLWMWMNVWFHLKHKQLFLWRAREILIQLQSLFTFCVPRKQQHGSWIIGHFLFEVNILGLQHLIDKLDNSYNCRCIWLSIDRICARKTSVAKSQNGEA